MPDGSRALALSIDQQALATPLAQRHAAEVRTSLQVLARVVQRRGSRFVFAPLPDVGNVYPELYPPTQRARIVEPSLVDWITAESRLSGVTVVDFPRIFRANKWPYLFRTDDTHWNDRAVELSSWVLSSVVRSLSGAGP